MKTRAVGSLPGIHEWEKYMSVDAISLFPVVAPDAFLANDDFGKTLMVKKTGELPEFRARCRQFLDRLTVVIVGSVCVTSGVSRCLYSFCPEILFEGDDSGVFALCTDLCRLLKVCNVITAEESRCAVDEFSSYVIEKRVQHRSSGQSASGIGDVLDYLLGDFSFQSRELLVRIFKLCCLAIETSIVDYPSVSISLSGSSLREDALQNCIKLVQSYVLSQGYCHQRFFTGQTMDAVQAAVDEAGIFFVCGEIDLWKDFVGPTYTSFISAHRKSCNKLLLQRRREYEVHYIECNKTNRLARMDQSVRAASNESGSVRSGPSQLACGTSVGKSATVTAGSTNPKPKRETLVVQKKSDVSTAKKPKKGGKRNDEDPDVVHKLKKPSKR